MEYPINSKYSAMGHGGDIMGVDTWMLYMPSEDIGIIYFANGNPAYGLTPMIGTTAVQILLYSLFKKGGVSMSLSPNIMNYLNNIINDMNPLFFTKKRISS
jgi:hypothetical protein